jgi:AcrR family transcriptional regulator
MTDKEKNTEAKILEAAKEVFLKKGMAGARMQEIADEAGINKALLHYYYRSKEKLFLAVFQFAIKNFVPGIQDIILADVNVEKKIRLFVENYIDVLLQHPFVPLFIIQEIHRDSERLYHIFRDAGVEPEKIMQLFKKEMDEGKIRQMDPRELIINILSLCIFPFAAKPVMKKIFFQDDSGTYKEFLISRKKTVGEFILNAIQK